jgi:predicted ATP-dependent endonuclease of OLD family
MKSGMENRNMSNPIDNNIGLQCIKIDKISIKNFRLLKDIPCLSFDKETTVIVGRNNSGKTSLTELFSRLLGGSAPTFTIDDFSIGCYEDFLNAFLLFQKDNNDQKAIRLHLPKIEIKITVSYDTKIPELGPLGDFIIDLNPDSATAIASITYELKEGEIETFFSEIPFIGQDEVEQNKTIIFKLLKDRIPKLFAIRLLAIDPNDESNVKQLSANKLSDLFQAGFINAQRGLDDTTHKEKDVLGRILGKLFEVAKSDNASDADQSITKELKDVTIELQSKIDSDFNQQLNSILPALKLFGYPGLSDPNISTETTLDVEKLLENHTRICYINDCGLSLPETYNGLGSRNLIYILFHIYQFFKTFQTTQTAPGIHLVFIEEPEAHLHPQMQEVFISQLTKIAETFSNTFNNKIKWPVQFIITTHSTHIANRASFDSIRYFFSSNIGTPYTVIKDLQQGFKNESFKEDKEFLHKYLTLTKCDLFFADKAILIEGPSERILLPKIIEKSDVGQPQDNKLSSQYLSIVEIGGAYAHHFYPFLEFLELKTLIITDIDSVKDVKSDKGKTSYHACIVSEGVKSSNTGINKWYPEVTISDLLKKSNSDKENGFRRIAYQIPEQDKYPCGRSFEDAFILANLEVFALSDLKLVDLENAIWTMALSLKDKKTNFAIEYGIEKTTWNVPRYIKDGLDWLRAKPVAIVKNNIKKEDSNE